MSHAICLPEHSASMGRVLPFPMVPAAPPKPPSAYYAPAPDPQVSALPLASADNLIETYTRILCRVVHIARSLSDDQRLTLLGHATTLEAGLNNLQVWVERHRSFLSDLSAKQARKRRRRQRRVKEQLSG